MTPHLTHEQLCDILLDRSPHPLSSDFAAIRQHLESCPICTGELTTLTTSLSLLRNASTSFAQQQLTHISPAAYAERIFASHRPKPLLRPVYLAVAAVILLAAVIPFNHSRRQPLPQQTVVVTAQQTDEALLEEISQTISEPIPTPMRPLADPTASSDSSQSIPAHTAVQRNN